MTDQIWFTAWARYQTLDMERRALRDLIGELYTMAMSEGVDFTKQPLTKAQELRYGQPTKKRARYRELSREVAVAYEILKREEARVEAAHSQQQHHN